jgi:hypothetical protein
MLLLPRGPLPLPFHARVETAMGPNFAEQTFRASNPFTRPKKTIHGHSNYRAWPLLPDCHFKKQLQETISPSGFKRQRHEPAQAH